MSKPSLFLALTYHTDASTKSFTSIRGSGFCRAASFLVAACALAVHATPALAIPSPELIIGSLSSLSQLLTIGLASVGGVAAVGFGMSARRSGASAKAARRMSLIALGLLVVALISAMGNIYQYRSYSAERQERLEATLTRPSRDPGAPVADPTLREYSFNQQLRHKNGISTADANKLMSEAASGLRPDVFFLDIRETAETEMGTLPDAKISRGPDLPKSGIGFEGKTAILFCHNGNRSAENCEALAARGINCKFVVGGLEKWVVEGRKMTGLENRTLDTLRAVPDFPNARTLLDTKEVKNLVDNEGAIFVDLRYPGEFAQRHIPGAINITMRTATTEDIKARVAALPKKPVIVPCYDRRSCFFGELMGLELHRMGGDFRGRYTVPWEYFRESTRPPHVVEWQAQKDRTYWSIGVEAVADVLVSVSKWLPFPLVLLLLALLSRLIILPVALKAERDQIVSKKIAPEVAALKVRLADDPQRMSRALGELFRQHKMTPMRNLLGLLFLPILAISVSAVDMAAGKLGTPFFWVENGTVKDFTFVLPLLFGALLCLYIDLSFPGSTRRRVMIWVGGMALFGGMAAVLGAASSFYIVLSAALILLQRLYLTLDRKSVLGWLGLRRNTYGIKTLSEPDVLTHCGNKAYRLARMKAAGIPVPDGFVLDDAFIATYRAAAPSEREKMLDQAWNTAPLTRAAVRSSAAGEDVAEFSFAGVFESVLHIERTTLAEAVDHVIASFSDKRAEAYAIDASSGNILVQQMVDAEYAGVLFTRSPNSGGHMMVEMVRGTADAFVSGAATPETFCFGRTTSHLQGDKHPPISVLALLEIGRKAEQLFGGPQDIEWAYRGGEFFIVQSRDITRAVIGDKVALAIEDERARLIERASGAQPGEVVLARTELAELLPRPTALSLSLMNEIWSVGGSVDRACRSLGLTYNVGENTPSYVTPAFGRLYIDRRQELARAPVVSTFLLRKLTKQAETIEASIRGDLFAEIESHTTLMDAVDFGKMSTPDLLATFKRQHERFVGGIYAEVESVNILASLFVGQATALLTKAGVEPSAVLAGAGETLIARGIAAAEAATSPEERRAILLQTLGHRASFDYELSQPRYGETVHRLEQFAAGWPTGADLPAIPDRLSQKAHKAALAARRFQTLKEDAKHMALRELAALRRIAMALDDRFELGGLAFWLTSDELKSFGADTEQKLRELAVERRDLAAIFADLPGLPSALTAEIIENAVLTDSSSTDGAGALKGSRVAGSKPVEGRARVIAQSVAELGGPIDDLEPGDIIVAPMIPHAWLPYFRTVAGLVSDVGGFLSHTAIVAREFDLAMVVGVAQWKSIPDRATIRLNPDGSIECIENQAALGHYEEAAE
ncbi:MAG: YidC/Oxa1 family membrane protein insertase [Rhizobiales bacterium]|nr:YidC/Oxa1 family membrane protein insertase [Hyphomicrobiales bacterium]